jgi:dihydrolipoamide dehydrogenase
LREHDVIVIGSGSGAIVADEALEHGYSVAIIDKGKLGGTCLNVGCIPSKLLIYPAERISEIKDSEKLGIKAGVNEIDFEGIMKRMRDSVSSERNEIRKGIERSSMEYYDEKAEFIDDYTLALESGDRIKGKKIFIASGARPLVPRIDGIEKADYLTNESVLELKKKPDSIVIVGGGYIAAEYGHFFHSMGTEITIVQREKLLLPNEEPEISALITKNYSERMKLYLNHEAVEIRSESVTIKDRDSGEKKELSADKVMIAAGRASNSDILMPEKSGIALDERGYIKVNEYLETSKKGIFAFGDAIGKQMFRHVANMEAQIAANNAFHKDRVPMDYSAAPHAVFSYPQIASVGMKEKDARKKNKVMVGTAKYSETAMGEAMVEKDGFAKIIVDAGNGEILGFHIIGPDASMLIHEVIVAMANKLSYMDLANAMHIHPALSEVVLGTLQNLK